MILLHCSRAVPERSVWRGRRHSACSCRAGRIGFSSFSGGIDGPTEAELLEAVCVIFGDALRPAASAPSAARIAPALRGDALAADDAADAEHETAVAADSG